MPVRKIPPAVPPRPGFREPAGTEQFLSVDVGDMTARKRNDVSPYAHSAPPPTSTSAGAAWLASAAAYPRSTLSLWEARPTDPGVLPCGSVFDVVIVPAVFGRRMLDRLWADGPGSGPVAVHRGRMLLFTSPGTAQRLPSLLAWEEWGRTGSTAEESGKGAVPSILCHGPGDAVTVPPAQRPRHRPPPRGTALAGRPPTFALRGCRAPRRCSWRAYGRPAPTGARGPGYRFFLPPIRVLRSTTSAGAASSVG